VAKLTRGLRGAYNVLSRARRAPRAFPTPSINRLPSPPFRVSPARSARARVPHRSTNRPRGRRWSEGRAGCGRREAERADRVAAKAQNHYHARPRGEQTCFSLPALNRDLRVALPFLTWPSRSPIFLHTACDISRQRG